MRNGSVCAGSWRRTSVHARHSARVGRVFCKYERIPEAVDISRMEHRYTDMSHHMILYPTTLTASAVSAKGVEVGQVFRCSDVQDRAVAGIIYATQGPKSATQYPDGVAYPLAQDQIVMIEYHAVNTSNDRADLKVLLNLSYATTPKEFNAGTLFFYNYSILVPPRSQASATMRCNVPSDMTVLAGSSHITHEASRSALGSWTLPART
jgi:hypothetical protein